jgi:hypothetical protein
MAQKKEKIKMPIVKYFEDENGNKQYDVPQALEDGGWGIKQDDLRAVSGMLFMHRKDPNHRVLVTHITHDILFNFYLVFFQEGGYLCLDHAIEQFIPLGGKPYEQTHNSGSEV